MNHCSQHAAQKYLPFAGHERRIGIALCGEGFRAALFQLGALRRLNEFGLLSRAATISCVSGGSITGAVLGVQWNHLEADSHGVFTNFDPLVTAPVEKFVTRTLKPGSLFFERLKPWNWGKISRGEISDTELLARQLDRRLFRGHCLADLPENPRFIIGATNMRTGRTWTFQHDSFGEVLLGYVRRPKYRIANAVAASLSSPLEYTPATLRLAPGEFEGGVLGPKADCLRDLVTLTSGAVNDCLATEPIWKSHGTLICIDGADVYPPEPNYQDWFGNRLLRALRIHGEAASDARRRWLIASYASGHHTGALISLTAYHGNYGLHGSVGYPTDVVDQLTRTSPDYLAFQRTEVMTLVNHGYTIGDTALRRYLATRLVCDAKLKLPYPEFVDRQRVLAAIEENARFRVVGMPAA